MTTGNPAIDAKIEADCLYSKWDAMYKARFMIGDFILDNHGEKVAREKGRLNFKVKPCGKLSTKHQVTFNDKSWAIYDIINNDVSFRCGNI